MISPSDLPPVRVVERADPSALCNASRLTLSPSGQYLAAWTPTARRQLSATLTEGGPPYVTVADVPCLFRSEQGCLVSQLISPLTFRAASWTPTDELVLMPTQGPIRRWRPGDPTTEELAPEVPVSDRSRLTLSGVFPVEALQELTVLAKLGEAYRVGPLSYWRGKWYGAHLNRSDHQLDLAEGVSASSRLERLSLSARFVGEEAIWAHGRGGENYLAGGGAFHRIQDGRLAAVFPELITPEPIYDARAWEVIGAHDDRQVRFIDPADDPGLPPADDGLAFYSSLTINASAQAYGYVFKEADGSHQIVLGRAGQERRIDCEAAPYRPVPQHQITNEDWGGPGWKLPVRMATLEGPSRGAAVIWLGGPGETIAHGGAEFFEQAWLRRGFNTVTVEGSGALGPEPSQRLREHGVNALVRDGRVAAMHVARHLPSTQQVVVEGSSLGAIAASTMAAELDRLRGGESMTALVLVAPWLMYRDPEATDGSHDFRRSNAGFARLSERASFGAMHSPAGDGFADAMEQWRTSFVWTGPILALFGRMDAISTPDDLWDAARGSPLTRVIVADGGHQVVGSSEKADEQIETWLKSLAAKAGSAGGHASSAP